MREKRKQNQFQGKNYCYFDKNFPNYILTKLQTGSIYVSEAVMTQGKFQARWRQKRYITFDSF